MSLKLLISLFCVALSTIFLSGCYFVDPAALGDVAHCPGDRWFPCPRDDPRDIPILASAETVSEKWNAHEGPWEVVDLLDIALLNNPLTWQSWESARASAFSWWATQSTLYPAVTFNEEYLVNKIEGSVTGSTVGAITNNNVNFLNSGIVNNTNLLNATSPFAANGVPRGVANAGNASAAAAAVVTPPPPTFNQWLISSVSFSYLMLDFGGRTAFIESARQALLAADWTYNRNMQTIVVTVLTDYYLHLQAKALFAARELDLKDSLETYVAAEAQFQAGVTTIVDVFLARSNLANAELQLEQARGMVKTTLGQLATVLGLPANTEFGVGDLPSNINLDVLNTNVDALIAIAKLERPDLAAAEAMWRQARENITVTWSSGMPTITANGFAQDTHNIHFPPLSSRLYSGSLMLNVPIFNGFLYVNETRSAEATAAAALAAWKNQEETVMLDVVTSYYNFTTALETVKFSNEFYEYTKKAFDAALEAYKTGAGNILNVLTAQTQLSDARAQQIQARVQLLVSLADIAYATGQL